MSAERKRMLLALFSCIRVRVCAADVARCAQVEEFLKGGKIAKLEAYRSGEQ
jgi:hypothetical protein